MKASFTFLITILLILFRVSAFAIPDLESTDSLNLEEHKFFKNPFSGKDKKKTASLESSIAGATLFYNLNGNNIDNLVGAANVKLNTASNFTGDFRLNVVGNITKVAGELNGLNEFIFSLALRVGSIIFWDSLTNNNIL